MKPVKILFINSSPNINGNTAILIHWVEESVIEEWKVKKWL